MKTMDDLYKTCLEALDQIPFLIFEIGYNRVTGWMFQVWDSSGTMIKDAPQVVSMHDGHDGDFRDSIIALNHYVNRGAQNE